MSLAHKDGMPPADPADREVRLLRAIYGLCPECDREDEHEHGKQAARVTVTGDAGTPTGHVTPTDKAWMAAVIDLRGAVVRKNNKSRRTPQVVLTLSVKDERIAQRLSALTGTAPEQHPAPTADSFLRRGCAQHCIVPHVHVDIPYPWQMPAVTRWSLTGVAAAVVLSNLAPYMSTFPDYAADVAEVTGNFAATGQGSGAVRATVRRLEQLGWKIPPAIARKIAAGMQEGGN